jgi:hypothetical protein
VHTSWHVRPEHALCACCEEGVQQADYLGCPLFAYREWRGLADAGRGRWRGKGSCGNSSADVLGPGVVDRLWLMPQGRGAMGGGRWLVAGSVEGAGAVAVAGYWGALQGVSGPLRWLLDRCVGVPLAPRGLMRRPELPGLPEKCAGLGLREQGASQELDLRWLRGPRTARGQRESGRPGLCWQSGTWGPGELQTSGPVRRAGAGYLSAVHSCGSGRGQT